MELMRRRNVALSCGGCGAGGGAVYGLDTREFGDDSDRRGGRSGKPYSGIGGSSRSFRVLFRASNVLVSRQISLRTVQLISGWGRPRCTVQVVWLSRWRR